MARTGRPRDEFSWAQVEVTEDGGWISKLCKEDFKGSATRIKNHLSSQGTDISACPAVSEEIRKEALKKGTRKRQRRPLQSSSSSTPASLLQDPSPSSSNDIASFTKNAIDEYVTDAFIKFLMCGKFSSVGSEVLKDPYFREYMERACKYGVASSLLQGDSLVMEKSLLNIKQEVSQYMLMVKESWKTTGCTMMMFNLNRENKGKSFVFEKDRYVCGFYCPKGFIFVEAPDPDIDYASFKDDLERHSPSLDIDYADHGICHLESKSNEDDNLKNDYLCEFNDDGKKLLAPLWQDKCLRQEIQRTCIKVCSISDWAQGLIDKAIKIQKLIQSDADLACWCDRLLTEKGKRLKHKGNLNAKGASGLSNFLSIMLLEDELKEKLSYEMQFRRTVCNKGDVEAILNDRNFWGGGRKLERVLNLILKISDLMDTLVPTVGYSAMAINKVVDTVFKQSNADLENVHLLWEKFRSQFKLTTRGILLGRGAVGYLNPLYYLQQLRKDPKLQDKVVQEMQDSLFFSLVATEKLKGELTSYHDVCINLRREIKLHNYHPVKFWEKYGGELPTLQKLAIKVLSQPVTCMCNQVKKHLYELQGADDFILRLNLRMMQQFKILGDDIYKPIDLSELKHCDEENDLNPSEEEEEDEDDNWTPDCKMIQSLDVEFGYWDPNGVFVEKGNAKEKRKASQAKGVRRPKKEKGSTSTVVMDFADMQSQPIPEEESQCEELVEATVLMGVNFGIDNVDKFWFPYIGSVKDVTPDGHCGYRALALLLRWEESEYKKVRQDLLVELVDNKDLYEPILGLCRDGTWNDLVRQVNFTSTPCDKDCWFHMPFMGLVFATCYQVGLVLLCWHQPTLCLPLRWTRSDSGPPRVDLGIALIGKNDHFVPVLLRDESPLPPTPVLWRQRANERMLEWKSLFKERFNLYQRFRVDSGRHG